MGLQPTKPKQPSNERGMRVKQSIPRPKTVGSEEELTLAKDVCESFSIAFWKPGVVLGSPEVQPGT